MMKSLFFCLTILFVAGFVESCDSLLGNDSPADGKMMFWSDFSGAPIDVYIDNKYEGTIGQYFSTTPDCGADGCVTVTLTTGTYHFHGEEQKGPGSTGQTWDKDISVVANSCGALELSSNSIQRITGPVQLTCSVNSLK